MEEPNSLVIEILGLRATALGFWPVVGLLMTVLICFLVVAAFGPAKISEWTKKLAKPSDK